MGALKRLLVGRPLATDTAHHQLLPVAMALPVFASDALSSNAYATEEILHVLEEAGPSALGLSVPIAAAVAILLGIVIVSYRQTVMAYPRGGGSYVVTKENLGAYPGLLAAAALLTDYILTVAVSISAGAAAIASLVPSLQTHRMGLSLGFVALVTLLNLRGAKESGLLFAIPTYGFVLSVVSMIVIGLVRCAAGGCPEAIGAGEAEAHADLSLFLILLAFSSGATALTGVEAIADGVPAFKGKRPSEQARNAARTLALLGVIATVMFIGITVLANRMGAVPNPDRTVVAQVAAGIFNEGIGFAIVQIMTMLILVLAANTAYADFPRLSSILARDRYMPRQFINRGDRLVFSNGVVMLALFAAALIVAFKADVQSLIKLYVVGVFTSFTLSQAGMVMRWLRVREPSGWQRRAAINAFGAATTMLVLVVVSITKFGKPPAPGAWMVIAAMPVLIAMMRGIHSHYRSVSTQLRLPEGRPRAIDDTRVVVLVARVDEATMRALGYAIALRPREVRAIHVGRGAEARVVKEAWEERRLTVPLEIIEGNKGDILGPIRAYVREMPIEQDEVVTVVLPEVFDRKGVRGFLSRRRMILLKTALLFERRVVLTNVPVSAKSNWHQVRGAVTPTRVVAIVLVSAVHNATLRALEYAKSLSPTDLRAVIFNVEPDETGEVLEDWGRIVDDISLEAVDSPYREVARPMIEYAARIRRQMPDAVVSIILPEFVVRRFWHQILHNQTALAIKAAVQFEDNVVLTSVPFHLR